MMKNHKKVNTFQYSNMLKKPRGRVVMNERGEHVYRLYKPHELLERISVRLPYKDE